MGKGMGEGRGFMKSDHHGSHSPWELWETGQNMLQLFCLLSRELGYLHTTSAQLLADSC